MRNIETVQSWKAILKPQDYKNLMPKKQQYHMKPRRFARDRFLESSYKLILYHREEGQAGNEVPLQTVAVLQYISDIS